MKTVSYKEKAEAYVREKLPELTELSFGCVLEGGESAGKYIDHDGLGFHVYLNNGGGYAIAKYKALKPEVVVGHPIQLQRWLKVISDYDLQFQHDENVLMVRRAFGFDKPPTAYCYFSLLIGQPATEEDYKAFCEIVGA